MLAVAAAPRPGARLGAIVDGRHGGKALARLNASGAWIGRPVELPASRPLEFEAAGGIGLELLHGRGITSSSASSTTIRPIRSSCGSRRKRGSLSLRMRRNRSSANCSIEVICSGPGRTLDAGTTPTVMRRLYHLGLRPAWWKLESQPAQAWREIADVVAAHDPLCHGVLLLGLDASEDQVAQSFEVAARHPVCRGFAIGRTIFGAPARDWFAGKHRRRDRRSRASAPATRA